MSFEVILREGKRPGLLHLTNGIVSCVFAGWELASGEMELLMPYFGAALRDPESAVFPREWREHASFDSVRQVLPYAVPSDGRGDYREPLVCAEEKDGSRASELFWDGSYDFRAGKPLPEGLPHVWIEAENEAATLTLPLRDSRTGLLLEAHYTLMRHRPVLITSLTLSNRGEDALTLTSAGSLSLHLHGCWDFVHLHGGWAKERQIERTAPARMIRMIQSCRGASGHEHSPFAALAAPDATEFSGECCGVTLLYSGDFRIAAEENAYGTTRLNAGLNPRTLRWQLSPGEVFQTPEAAAVWSGSGMNGMSQAFHSLIRERICRGFWQMRERPVLVNNWEATYFGFNQQKILEIARCASRIGAELMVLDDGWFGRRDSDNCSLGDWKVDSRKLPDGLGCLSGQVEDLGLKFGLWFEPEMISPDSDLYRAHPDWCLHLPHRRRTEERNQLILDFSRKEVQDAVVKAVGGILRSARISYVKWDMNRNFTEAGSAAAGARQGEIPHRYMLGVYRVMEELTQAFPEVLFEGCSGGGGRFDAGILYYMPQFWTSDDTDAVERLRIQYGTSLFLPACTMGAHVSAVPNHQVGRVTPLSFRCDVALGGNFGLELDLTAQTDEDLDAMRRAVERVKDLRSTTAGGTFTRLLSPFEGDVTAWQFEDSRRLIVCVYRERAHANDARLLLRLKNLPEDAVFETEEGKRLWASDLMRAGMDPDLPETDYASRVIVLNRVG